MQPTLDFTPHAPVPQKTFARPRIIAISDDGYYLGDDGKRYIPRLFDNFFQPQHNLNIKPRGYKGENPGKYAKQ